MIEITNLGNIVEIIVLNNLNVNDTKRMCIWKSDVTKLRLVNAPEIYDIVKIHYSSGDTDEVHFASVSSIDGIQPTSNIDMYEKLKVIFNA